MGRVSHTINAIYALHALNGPVYVHFSAQPTSEKEKPHTPHGRPEPNPWALAHWPGVESVVDQMLQVLAGSDLSHQAVLVSVHACQLTDVGEDILQAISKLEGVNITQPVVQGKERKVGEGASGLNEGVSDARGGRRVERLLFATHPC